MYLEWIDILKSSPLFRGISNESLSIMLDCLKPKIKRYKQREIIVTYGQPFQGVGIIASGKVALTKETYSGNRIMMGILSAGDIFGEVVAFSDDRVWPMTVIAQVDCTMLLLPPDKTLPVIDGRVEFGTWQSLLFVETDVYPRQRTVIMQVMGK